MNTEPLFRLSGWSGVGGGTALITPTLLRVAGGGLRRPRLSQSRVAGMIITGSLLRLANEQTVLVLLAVPFGAVCVVVGLNLIARDGQVPNDQQAQSAQLRANQ